MRLLKKPTTFVSIILFLLSSISQLHAEKQSDSHRTILILGDSLSAAYGIELEQSWPQLLANHLSIDDLSKEAIQNQSEPHPSLHTDLQSAQSGEADNGPHRTVYSVVNASISGDTTGGGLRRLPELLKTHQPYLVIIELGGNDGLRGFPIARLRNNLSELVQLSQQAGAKVLLAGMRIPPNYGPRYTEQFFESYQLIAERYKTALIPFFLDGVALNPALMQRDGIHPTAEAQRLILQNVLPVLKPLL